MIVLGALNNSKIPGYLTWIKTYNHVMLSNPKHISTPPFYVDIINGIFPHLIFNKETTNPDEMEIKDNLVLNGMTLAAAEDI